MHSQTFCYWAKQQSADSYISQFHLTLKCTKDQSSHLCDCLLVLKWIFQNHSCGLTEFHPGPEQLLLCAVINNSSHPPVKHNNTANHTFGKCWMHAGGFPNNHSKYCWPKAFYCTCQPNEREIKKKNWRGQAKMWREWPT